MSAAMAFKDTGKWFYIYMFPFNRNRKIDIDKKEKKNDSVKFSTTLS